MRGAAYKTQSRVKHVGTVYYHPRAGEGFSVIEAEKSIRQGTLPDGGRSDACHKRL